MHRPGEMPLNFLLLMDSVMSRRAPMRCGKWPGSARTDPGCALIKKSIPLWAYGRRRTMSILLYFTSFAAIAVLFSSLLMLVYWTARGAYRALLKYGPFEIEWKRSRRPKPTTLARPFVTHH